MAEPLDLGASRHTNHFNTALAVGIRDGSVLPSSLVEYAGPPGLDVSRSRGSIKMPGLTALNAPKDNYKSWGFHTVATRSGTVPSVFVVDLFLSATSQ